MDGVWSHPVPLVPAVAGSLSRDAVIDPQGAAAGALWQQNVWMVCARGCHMLHGSTSSLPLGLGNNASTGLWASSCGGREVV